MESGKHVIVSWWAYALYNIALGAVLFVAYMNYIGIFKFGG